MGDQLIVAYRAVPPRDEGQTYVVLGAPRGGTSMLAGSLQILGVPMGSTNAKHEDPVFHDERNIARMIKTIGERNRAHRCWGWKLPNTIYYYDRIARHVRNPVFMVIYRNPFDIFMSAASKGGEGLTEPHFNAPVLHYEVMHRLINKRRNIPVYATSYDAACRDPDRFIDELAALLPFVPSAESVIAAKNFVNAQKGYTAIPTPSSAE